MAAVTMPPLTSTIPHLAPSPDGCYILTTIWTQSVRSFFSQTGFSFLEQCKIEIFQRCNDCILLLESWLFRAGQKRRWLLLLRKLIHQLSVDYQVPSSLSTNIFKLKPKFYTIFVTSWLTLLSHIFAVFFKIHFVFASKLLGLFYKQCHLINSLP